jgi:predicted permease
MAPSLYFIYRDESRVFDEVSMWTSETASVTGMAEPEELPALLVTNRLLPILDVQAAVGRPFTAADEDPKNPRTVMLADGYWKSRFGGDRGVIGRNIILDGRPSQVIGVLPASFQFMDRKVSMLLPLRFDRAEVHLGNFSYQGVARLKPGVTLAQATTDVARMLPMASKMFPPPEGYSVKMFEEAHIGPNLRFLKDDLVGDIGNTLWVLMGTVGMVLLIACANVANLLLARATGRQREIAIRAALGARRGRIVQQLLTESLLLAVAGGVSGLVLGSWGVRALLHLAPGDLPRVQEIASIPALDLRVAGFTVLLAVITGVLFGLFPAMQVSRAELGSALKESSGRMGTGLKHNRTRSFLVGAEVATAVVLLCGAALLIRSFVAMHAVSLGFDPHNLLTMEVSLAGPGYAKSSAVDRLGREFVQRVEGLSGVESAALASALPLWGQQDMLFSIPGRRPLQGYHFTGDVQWLIVSPHYFEALRIPLLAGRFLHDREPGRTVVISQTMARKYWPDANPIGQTIVVGPGLGPGYDVDPAPIMYQAPSQVLDGAMALVNRLQPGAVLIRTRPGVAPMSVSHAVRQALLAADQLPAAKIRTMEQVSRDSTARQNFNLLLLAIFAAIALLLAAVGIYGVMSYSVEQRTHEIGIRAAMGASRRDTLNLVLLHALRMAMAGIAAGIAASFGLTRLLSAQLFGVKPSDPLTFATVPLILLAVALAAAWMPALRASRLDPLTALRHE